MKHTTLESRIDFAISATLQADQPTEQTVASVNRLLSAFKHIGQTQQSMGALDQAFFEDDLIYN